MRLFKGQARARTETGHFWQSILIGLDDQSLVGARVWERTTPLSADERVAYETDDASLGKTPEDHEA